MRNFSLQKAHFSLFGRYRESALRASAYLSGAVAFEAPLTADEGARQFQSEHTERTSLIC
jgi:hypothetical protein